MTRAPEGNVVDVELMDDSFINVPEAVAKAEEEAGATIYVRTNQTLKRQAELAAKEAGLSLNAYVIRCLEAGVAPDEKSRMALVDEIMAEKG